MKKPLVAFPDPNIGDRWVFLASCVFTAAAMATNPSPERDHSALFGTIDSPADIADDTALNQAAVTVREVSADIAPRLAKTWKISEDLARTVVDQAIDSGFRHQVDPLLVLAVIAVESSYRPNAVSSKQAEGLMQVRRVVHQDKLQAAGVARDQPMSVRQNIEVGTRVLKGYLTTEANQLRPALQRYNGARTEPEQRYARKVLEQYRPLIQAHGTLISTRAHAEPGQPAARRPKV